MLGNLFFDKEKKLENIVLQVVENENYTRTCEVSEYPIETGFVSDSITNNFPEITIDCWYGTKRNTLLNDLKKDWRQIFDDIENLIDKKQPVSLVIGLKTFNDLVITNFSVDRNKEVGEGMKFSLSFKQIKKVNLKFSEQNVKNQNMKTKETNNIIKKKNVTGQTEIQKTELEKGFEKAIENKKQQGK